MQPALLIRLRPFGPWRYGPADGGHDRVDALYRSDRLFSAVTLAMQRLGLLDEWLDATARAPKPAVVFSSLFPFQGDTLFAPPPATLWPPPANLLNTPSPVFLAKIRWKSARFVPLSLIDSLATGQPVLADQWVPDPESGCLLRRDRPSSIPFRAVTRSSAAVDRVTCASGEVKSLACVEFEPGAGLWTIARYESAEAESKWSGNVQAAFRLLADSGFGGGRTKGWGQAQGVEFQKGAWPLLLLPKVARLSKKTSAENEASDVLYWLLSLYSPAAADKIDWSGGDYSLAVRAGRVESSAGSGLLKKSARMVNEGCVIAASEEPIGAAVDVAPDGFAHPVYRSGFALAVRLPVPEIRAEDLRAIEPAAEPEVPTAETLEAEAAAEVVEVAELTEHSELTQHSEPAEHAEPVELAEPVESAESVEPAEHEIGSEEAPTLAVEPAVQLDEQPQPQEELQPASEPASEVEAARNEEQPDEV